MQLFSADATMFLKKIKFIFCPQKVEKTTLKSGSEFSNPFFFLTTLTAQTAQIFISVLYKTQSKRLFIGLGRGPYYVKLY